MKLGMHCADARVRFLVHLRFGLSLSLMLQVALVSSCASTPESITGLFSIPCHYILPEVDYSCPGQRWCFGLLQDLNQYSESACSWGLSSILEIQGYFQASSCS